MLIPWNERKSVLNNTIHLKATWLEKTTWAGSGSAPVVAKENNDAVMAP